MEAINAEEIRLNGLLLKFDIKLNALEKNYTVMCKAYDQTNRLLWNTDLLDQNGKPQTFHSIATAVSKTRTMLAVYKKQTGVPT